MHAGMLPEDPRMAELTLDNWHEVSRVCMYRSKRRYSHTRSTVTDAFTQINAICTVTPTFVQTFTSNLAPTYIADSPLSEGFRMLTSK